MSLPIIAVLGTTTYIIQQRQDKVVEKVRQEEEVATLPEKPEIGISDWKVYRNEKYRFEVKYPKNWVQNFMKKHHHFF